MVDVKGKKKQIQQAAPSQVVMPYEVQVLGSWCFYAHKELFARLLSCSCSWL